MIRSEVSNRIGTIYLDRPEKRNAFNPELVEALKKQVHAFNQDPNIRAILFRGEGEAFSAGADLKYLSEIRHNSIEENEADSASLAELFELIYNSPKLTYSAVDGYALAGGCGLATVTDFCYATEKAKFGYTEVMIGFVPAIVMVYLSRKVSGAVMNDLLLTGAIVSAGKAHELGLVTKILDFERFYDEVHSIIQSTIQKVSAEAIKLTKGLMRSTFDLPRVEGISEAIKTNAMARSTEDCIKGVDAFLNKTKVSW